MFAIFAKLTPNSIRKLCGAHDQSLPKEFPMRLFIRILLCGMVALVFTIVVKISLPSPTATADEPVVLGSRCGPSTHDLLDAREYIVRGSTGYAVFLDGENGVTAINIHGGWVLEASHSPAWQTCQLRLSGNTTLDELMKLQDLLNKVSRTRPRPDILLSVDENGFLTSARVAELEESWP